MNTLLIVVVALFGNSLPPSPPIAPLCTRASGDEARAISRFRGAYRVLGSRSEQPYVGQVTLSGADDSVALNVTGTVDGLPRHGTARHVRCGPDRVKQLEITLRTGATLYCVLHNDYDN